MCGSVYCLFVNGPSKYCRPKWGIFRVASHGMWGRSQLPRKEAKTALGRPNSSNHPPINVQSGTAPKPPPIVHASMLPCKISTLHESACIRHKAGSQVRSGQARPGLVRRDGARRIHVSGMTSGLMAGRTDADQVFSFVIVNLFFPREGRPAEHQGQPSAGRIHLAPICPFSESPPSLSVSR